MFRLNMNQIKIFHDTIFKLVISNNPPKTYQIISNFLELHSKYVRAGNDLLQDWCQDTTTATYELQLAASVVQNYVSGCSTGS